MATGARKIVWAVDAFDQPGALQSRGLDALLTLAYAGPHADPEIWIVTVLSPATLSASIEFSGPWTTDLKPMADEKVKRIAERVRAKGLQKVETRVLIQPFVSTSRAAEILNQFASKLGADFLVVGTHGRKGIGRAFLGSFAETLIQHATLPVVTVGAKVRLGRNKRAIVFPTEFGPNLVLAKNAFRSAVSVARELDARVTLFHVLPQPVEPFLQSGSYLLGGSWVPVSMYFLEAEESVRHHAEGWARWAEAQGVHVDVEIELQGGRISDSILRLARKHRAGWIIMEAHTGPLVSALVGSVTRQVLRAADCPVIVLHKPHRGMARKAAA